MIHSILIIGQSNMAGRGELKDAPETIDERLLVLRNGRWQHLHRPVNFDRPFSGYCLAETFADAYAREKNVLTGIIPCADGGTCLDQWQEGSLLYDNAVYQARLAQRTSTIAAVLWHQGESDMAENRYPLYAGKLEKIMTALRRDLDLYDVPFLLGGLGDYLVNYASPHSQNYVHINAALMQYAEQTPMTGFVCAEGLHAKEDNLHFDTPSLMEFGKRYYAAFRQLENPDKVFSEKNSMDLANRSAMEQL